MKNFKCDRCKKPGKIFTGIESPEYKWISLVSHPQMDPAGKVDCMLQVRKWKGEGRQSVLSALGIIILLRRGDLHAVTLSIIAGVHPHGFSSSINQLQRLICSCKHKKETNYESDGKINKTWSHRKSSGRKPQGLEFLLTQSYKQMQVVLYSYRFIAEGDEKISRIKFTDSKPEMIMAAIWNKPLRFLSAFRLN